MSNCQWCKKELNSKRKKFCNNKCKNHFHNFHNPRGFGLKYLTEKDRVLLQKD